MTPRSSFTSNPYCLPAKLPHRRELSDPIVTLECRMLQRRRLRPPRTRGGVRDLLIAEATVPVDVIGLARSLGVIFTVILSVAILLVRGYRGSFAGKGARNRERSEPVPP